MKIGDLVKFNVMSDEHGVNSDTPFAPEHGIVLQISRTGHDTKSAKILFNDGEVAWIGTSTLEVISEGG